MPAFSTPSLVTASLVLLSAACSSKSRADRTHAADSTVATAPASSATSVSAADAAPDTAERSRKRAQLEYANMEAGFIGDSTAQWAATVRASTSFGETAGQPVDSTSPNAPQNARGAPDGRSWTNNNQSIGTDWLEAGFATPVSATEVRVVTTKGASAFSKLELIDVGGASHVVWSGVNEDAPEKRGERTWFIRRFDATPYQVKAARVTIANAVESNYKEIDAVQLVGR